MTKRQELIDHLANLERAREEAYAEGNWQRVDTLQWCIDDTRDAIKAAQNWHVTKTISDKTLDLIDAIENRGLAATHIEGFIGCIIAEGSSLEGLPRAACCVQYFPREGSYKVWWPAHPWTDAVQDYVDTIRDESGVAEATGE